MAKGLYHIETSPLICTANQWTGFYMIGASVMKLSNHVIGHVIAHVIGHVINNQMLWED